MPQDVEFYTGETAGWHSDDSESRRREDLGRGDSTTNLALSFRGRDTSGHQGADKNQVTTTTTATRREEERSEAESATERTG